MRIDKIELTNFRGFEHFEMNLHPQFTLLVGENGSGKTSVLSGLALGLSIWYPVFRLKDEQRVDDRDIHTHAEKRGDRVKFAKCLPVKINFAGRFFGLDTGWEMTQGEVGGELSTKLPPQLANLMIINELHPDSFSPENLLPLLVMYGSNRMGRSATKQAPLQNETKPSRFDAYGTSLSSKNATSAVHNWIILESAARDSEGRFRPGFETVRIALQECIPGVEKVWFDHDFLELAVRIDGQDRLFSTLSDGQLGMAAIVADLAIKAVTLNSHLLPAKLEKGNEAVARRVLDETPGVVLIDELDLHLHPKWQRSVATDLMRTFPKVQFVATSHSPQIIGELQPEMVMILEDNQAYAAPRSIGLDSNRVLAELMGAEVRNKRVAEQISEIARLIDDEELDDAKRKIAELAETVGEDDPEVTCANTMIHFLEDEAIHEND